MGYSIGKVFNSIEEEIKKNDDIVSLYMPTWGYSFKSLWKNIIAVREKTKSQNYDVIHITGQEHYLIPFIDKTKLVVTVHDLDSIISSEHGFAGKIKLNFM